MNKILFLVSLILIESGTLASLYNLDNPIIHFDNNLKYSVTFSKKTKKSLYNKNGLNKVFNPFNKNLWTYSQ